MTYVIYAFDYSQFPAYVNNLFQKTRQTPTPPADGINRRRNSNIFCIGCSNKTKGPPNAFRFERTHGCFRGTLFIKPDEQDTHAYAASALLTIAYQIKRSVAEPQTETVMRGPVDAFTRRLR